MGRPGLLLLYLGKGLGAASQRIVPVGSRCRPSQRTVGWGITALTGSLPHRSVPALLLALPIPPPKSGTIWLLPPSCRTTEPTLPEELRRLEWLCVYRNWRSMFTQLTYKCRLKPSGFDIHYLQLSSHLYNLEARIYHSIKHLVPALLSYPQADPIQMQTL